MSKPAVPLRDLVRSNIEVHGYAWAAAHASRRIPFTLFYWLAFGRAPRQLVSKPF